MTKNIKLDELTAKKLYKTASSELKTILEENFDKKTLSSDIRDRINTLDDIFSELGVAREEIIPWKDARTKKQKSQNSFAIIQAITEAYNEGAEEKVLDWSNRIQPKYYLWFEKKTLGGGWSLYVVYDDYYFAYLGSGSYFTKKENAQDAWNKFPDVWLDYLPK